MRYALLALLLTFTCFGCNDDDGESSTAGIICQGDEIELADGRQARLFAIEDVRCPCNADCLLPGYIGLNLVIGSDTILRTADAYGDGTSPDFDLPMPIYTTSRGDNIRVLNYIFEPEGCPGTIPGENICLEIEVL